MATVAERDVDRLLQHIDSKLPSTWTAWPGGWPNEVEAALIDAVLSIRSRYGSATTGVRRRVSLYRDHRQQEKLDDLRVLAGTDPEVLAAVLDTQQQTGGVLKSVAIAQAAGRLVDVGVQHAADMEPDSSAQKYAYIGVRGLGPVTWQYLLMLVGKPGVKADTWICRFVEEALDRPATPSQAEWLVREAALSRSVSPTDLDHAIWSHMSRRPSGRTSTPSTKP